jgi:hypothetical protein
MQVFQQFKLTGINANANAKGEDSLMSSAITGVVIVRSTVASIVLVEIEDYYSPSPLSSPI